MTRKIISFLIAIIFVVSLTACTPEIYINTGTNNENQQSVVESPKKEVADNTPSDSESAQNSQPQNTEEPKPDKQPDTQSDAAVENNESKPNDNTQTQSREETQNKKQDKNNNKNTQSNKNESQKTDSDSQQSTTPKTEDGKITKDEAKAIAFKHAAVTAQSVYDLDVELDRDNGKEIYEIEFMSERVEYAYEIDAKTGEILKSEKEIDD